MRSDLQHALAEYRALAQRFTSSDTVVRRLLDRAFSPDLELASDAIRKIEQQHDPALAALAWSFFWIQQGELFQAKRELERIQGSELVQTLWGGIDLMLLGHIYVELGEWKAGHRLIRSGRRILEEPLS